MHPGFIPAFVSRLSLLDVNVNFEDKTLIRQPVPPSAQYTPGGVFRPNTTADFVS